MVPVLPRVYKLSERYEYESSLVQDTVLTAKTEARKEHWGNPKPGYQKDTLIQVFNDATCSFFNISSCAKHRVRCFWP